MRPLAHPRRKRGYAGGKRNPDRTGGGITTAEKQALLAVLRLLAAGNDAAMAACDRLATLWGNPQPPKENVFAVLGQAILGKMILGRNK